MIVHVGCTLSGTCSPIVAHFQTVHNHTGSFQAVSNGSVMKPNIANDGRAGTAQVYSRLNLDFLIIWS